MDNVRLPDDIERGAKGGPGFNTSIITLSNGKEKRNQDWSVSRGEWDIGYGIRKRADLEAVYAFFMARRGMARSFRFKDWFDFKGVAEPVGTVSALVRQLQKTYPDDVNAYIRKIAVPILDTVKVYVDNILVTTGFTVSAAGLITFDSDPGEDVKATFEFDVEARFNIDIMPVGLNTYTEGEITGIAIVELK